MAPSKGTRAGASGDRASAKIAELQSRGFLAGASAAADLSPQTVPRKGPQSVSGVVVSAFRSLEELRAPAGALHMHKVDLLFNTIPLPVSGGGSRGGQPDSDPDRQQCGTEWGSNGVLADADSAAGCHDFMASSIANAENAVASAMAGMQKQSLATTAVAAAAPPGPTAAAGEAAVLRGSPPRRPPGFPSPPSAAEGPANHEQRVAGPEAPQQAHDAGSHPGDLKPPATPSTPAPLKYDPLSHARDAAQAAPPVSGQQQPTAGGIRSNHNSFSTDCDKASPSGLTQQHSSPPAPRTPQPAKVEAPQPSRADVDGVTSHGTQGQQRTPNLGPPQALGAPGRQAAAPRAHVGVHAGQLSRENGTSGALTQHGAHTGPYVSCTGYDPQQQLLLQQHFLLQQHQQQQQLLQQQQLQQAWHVQQAYQQQQLQAAAPSAPPPARHQQPRAQAQNLPAQQGGQGTQPRQSRQGAPAPPTRGAHGTPETLRPPQRPRPCAAFGAPTDVKGVEHAVSRAVTALFRREPKLFRDVYGYDLGWWLEARGKPLSEDMGDLLMAMVFHNYVAVAVRVDRGAAPGRRDRVHLLNPTVSALLNEKVYGNVLLLRVFKLDTAPDGASVSSCEPSAGSTGPVLQVRSLPLEDVHTCIQDSDNVAWQMNWYRDGRNAALADSLSSDERANWLARLPLVPLDKQGRPDLPKVLASIRHWFKLPASVAVKACKAAGKLTNGSRLDLRSVKSDEEGGAGTTTGADARRGGAGASDEEAGVPAELAPLLRALRCTSPWCCPALPRAGGRRGRGGSACPFGHFWRRLDLGERSSMLDPVFNAARHCHCAMTQLPEPELCPAIINRLRQRGWAVVQQDSSRGGGPPTEGRGVPEQLRSAARAQTAKGRHRLSESDSAGSGRTSDAGLPQVAKASCNLAANSGYGSAGREHGDDGKEDSNESDEDDEEQADEMPVPPPDRKLRVQDLTFYLSFCPEGFRCRRCHSFYELQLAEALQRFVGGGKGSSAGATSSGHFGTDGRRGCYEVLAALTELELPGQEQAGGTAHARQGVPCEDPGSPGASSADVSAGGREAAPAIAAAKAGTTAEPADELAEADPVAVAATAAAAALSPMTGAGGFNWADEPVTADEGMAAASLDAAAAAWQPPTFPQQHPPAERRGRAPGSAGPPPPLVPRAKRPQRPEPRPSGAGEEALQPPSSGMAWSSRAPICCHPAAAGAPGPREVAAAAAGDFAGLERDLRPLPALPDTLDLELELIPDRATVAASMAAKSRHGVYVPPHLRNGRDEGSPAADGESPATAGPAAKPDESAASSPAREVAAATVASGAVIDAQVPEQHSPAGPTPAALLENAKQVAAASPPQTGLELHAEPAAVMGGLGFANALQDATPAPALPTPGPLTMSLSVPAQPLPGPSEAVQHPHPGFPQVQEPGRPPIPIPVPVPVPVPVLAARQVPAPQAQTQPNAGLYRQADASAFSPSYPLTYDAVQPRPVEPVDDVSGAEDIVSDCMSLCGLPPANFPAAQHEGFPDGGHAFPDTGYGVAAAFGPQLPFGGGMAGGTARPDPGHLQPPGGVLPGYPQSFAHGPHHMQLQQQGALSGVLLPPRPPPQLQSHLASAMQHLAAAPPPNHFQPSPYWLQSQQPFGPPSFVPGRFGVAGPQPSSMSSWEGNTLQAGGPPAQQQQPSIPSPHRVAHMPPYTMLQPSLGRYNPGYNPGYS